MMKRLLILVAGAMLFAGPAFADNTSQGATVYRGNGKSTMTNTVVKTDVSGVTAANVGERNTIDIGVASNKNGTMTNTVVNTKVKDSTIINVGKDNTARVGGAYNE